MVVCQFIFDSGLKVYSVLRAWLNHITTNLEYIHILFIVISASHHYTYSFLWYVFYIGMCRVRLI